VVDVRVSTDHLVRTVRQQATACRDLGSPLYAALLERCADDISAGGPAADVLAGHEADPPSAAIALRLMGGVHRLVLEDRAPGLAHYYPSVGGVPDPDGAWPAFRQVLVDCRERLIAALEQPPQTNEVGRSSALLGGLLHLARERALPIGLHEIGCSAGLNLRADHFWYSSVDGHDTWGPEDSPVRLGGAWSGAPLPLRAPLRIASRSGTDIAPLDPTSPEGRLRLLSYVWPDQVERFNRLGAAIAVARRVSVEIEARDALTAVHRLRPITGRWTVLWHSVMWQYLDLADQDAIDGQLASLGEAATADAPVAHLFIEPSRRHPEAEHEFLVVLQVWPGGQRRVLGVAAPHGVPTTWD
jgi:hypothetical protein